MSSLAAETKAETFDMFMNADLHQQCRELFDGCNILITGATGSFGQAFVKVLLEQYNPRRVVIFSRDELKQSVMKQRFAGHSSLRFFLGDVRDRERLMSAFKGIDIIIHAAALKQVPALEYNPAEAIKTNVNGALNIIDAAVERGVKQVVALSTDKAAMPINLYGATKLCSDKLFVAGNTAVGAGPTRMAVVRYGNVFGSRGSIVPVIHKLRQLEEKMIGLTDERMTRFNITLQQAVNFVLSTLALMNGGEIFVPKLPSYRLPVIAEAVAPECSTKIIGRRPGEKIHELMVPEDEAYRTKEVSDRYIIEPDWGTIGAFQYQSLDGAVPVPDGFSYSSGSNSVWCEPQELKEQYKAWCAEHGYEFKP